jgi:predicted MPP superfamily phosphohydrolase
MSSVEFGPLEFVKLAIYYASWLAPVAALLFLRAAVTQRGPGRLFPAAGATLLAIFCYARFIEPRILLTIEHEAKLVRCFPDAGSARLAVFSDAHEGLFANAVPVARIVRRVNAAEPDAVLIAGDFVYFLAPQRFEETFKAFRTLTAPAFAVLGNHDVGLPGPDVGADLSPALEALNIRMIDDAAASIEINGQTIEIVGLSDLWAKNQKRKLLEDRGPRPRLVLTHNPGTIRELRKPESVDLMIAGHTHGGQINIPFVTCALTSACNVVRYGFLETDRGPVFVTSGTGMVGLPLRFNVAPRIDVINFSWRACG